MAPDVFVLLRLRWMQLRRAFPVYGLVLLVFLVIGCVFLLRATVLDHAARAPWISGAALLMLVGLHQRRPDHRFLQHHVPGARVAMALEYGVLVLPIVLGLFLGAAWFSALALFLALLVPWLPVMHVPGSRAPRLRRLVPARLFEWKSLMQATSPLGQLLWLAALGFCWLPLLPLLLIGGVALLVVGAQEQCEPRAMLLASAGDARSLLRAKVWGSLKLMSLISLPVLVGATFFQSNWWWIHGLFGFGMLVLVAYAVVLKYANYRPNERLNANGANVSVAAVFAILPGLGVVPLIMLMSEWSKARENLMSYFHDDHN